MIRTLRDFFGLVAAAFWHGFYWRMDRANGSTVSFRTDRTIDADGP